MYKTIRIATRESALAMWQAKHIQGLLSQRYPEVEVVLVPMTTQGDQILDKTLSTIGGKGLFVKELERAMRENRADLAVHSLKDVPMTLPEGFTLAAITDREDPRDAFVSSRFLSLDGMPEGAIVGTSSLRRELMLKSRYPSLVVKSVRGNVNTRLRKLDEGEFDALIMASAGLKRLGFGERICSVLAPEISLPAPGQGALGIECLSSAGELQELLKFLNNEDANYACSAERAVSAALGGSCQVPLAAYATIHGDELFLRALLGDHKTGKLIAAREIGEKKNSLEIAKSVVGELMSQGAEAILASVLPNA